MRYYLETMHGHTSRLAKLLVLLALSLASAVTLASLEEGDQLYRSGRFDEAAQAYEKVQGEQRARAVIGASRSYALLGEYDKAIALCRDALKQAGPQGGDALLSTQLAEVLFQTGRSDEALDILAEVVNRQDAALRSLVKYGEMLSYRGRREDAALYFSAAVSDYSSRLDLSAEETALAARAYWKLGDYQRANDLFRRATSLDRYNMEAQVWWGDLFAEKFNEAEAMQSYRTVLEFNPNYVPAAVGFARVSGQRGVLEQALFTNPRSAEAFVAYADLALKKNSF